MKPLKCPWRLCAKCFLITAGVFLLLLLGTAFIDVITDADVNRIAIYSNLAIQGSVWCGISFSFFMLSQKNKLKLQRLKRNGAKYESAIEGLNPLNGMKVMNYLTFRADCSYVNDEGKICLVRSHAMLMSKFDGAENIIAHIYVNRTNPKDYAVELLKPSGRNINADYDYR
jgi:hypothetical protein